MKTTLVAALAAAALCAALLEAQPSRFELVLRGGRVMDPASGLDDVRNVAIRDGRIATISRRTLDAPGVLDVTGLVVAPGFIDLHAHGQDPRAASGRRTTALRRRSSSKAVRWR